MARKTKYIPVRVAKIQKALEEGNTRKAAASLGGISFETFCQWMNNKSEFSDLITRAEFEAERRNVVVLQRAAAGYETTVTKRTMKDDKVVEEVTTTTREFDWRAAESWLKRRRREEWGDNVSVNIDKEIADTLALLAATGETEVS